jgi:hypothetical protein
MVGRLLSRTEERAADSSLEKNQQLRIKFIAKLA